MSTSKFEEFFGGVIGLTVGEMREAKPLLRYAFKSGVRGTGLANAMVGDDQWPRVPSSSQAILRRYVVAAYYAGESA